MSKEIDPYAVPRNYRPQIKAKHLRQFDREFLVPSGSDPSMSVLEIGCGTGIFLRYLKARGFKDVVAVDTDTGLREVLDDLGEYDIQLTDAAGSLERIGAARFDRVALFDVAEHLQVSDLVALMKSIHRVLKPGGRVVLRSPNCGSPWGLKMHFDTFDHVTPITSGRLRELATATGFEVFRIFGSRTGSRVRQELERLFCGAVGRMLTYRPDFWEPTIVGVFEKSGR